MKLRLIKLPKVHLPKIRLPRVKFPRLHIPKVTLPTLRLLEIRAPQISLPKWRLPQISIPQFKLPELHLPRIHLPQIKMPQIKMPQIHLPRIQMPRLRFPKMILPRLTLPQWSLRFTTENLKTLASVVACLMVFALFHATIGNNDGVWASGLSKLEINSNSILKITQKSKAEQLNSILPSAGAAQDSSLVETQSDGRYAIEDNVLNVEAVLIPRETTVVSSSRDGKIIVLNFDNGETFKKGDVLVAYACKDVKAEIEIAKTQKELSQEKTNASMKLFKLDIISNIEKLELETENKQAEARAQLYESKMEDCLIRAEYDGRVVKRLANSGEFTRTDRVLMEVASLDYLKAEFLLPSRWLRWVNTGAPVEIAITETEKTYPAEIKYIYGEVDPVSQSIQITAQLKPYDDALLPGMSGQASLDIDAIRRSGIYGFLEKKPQQRRP